MSGVAGVDRAAGRATAHQLLEWADLMARCLVADEACEEWQKVVAEVGGGDAADGDAADADADADDAAAEAAAEENAKEWDALLTSAEGLRADIDAYTAAADDVFARVDTLTELPRGGSTFVSSPDDAQLPHGETQEYVVKQIVGKRKGVYDGRPGPHYLCIWSGGGGLSWESREDIEELNLMDAYDTKLQRRARAMQTSRTRMPRVRTTRVGADGTCLHPSMSRKARRKLVKKMAERGGGGGAAGGGGEPDHAWLMHLDIPALRQYLQTVEDFTPLHYELLLRLSEDEVSRGASTDALARLQSPPPAPFAAGGACGVCLDTIDTAAEATAPPCGHAFHDDCIREWLAREKTCPLCKAEV